MRPEYLLLLRTASTAARRTHWTRTRARSASRVLIVGCVWAMILSATLNRVSAQGKRFATSDNQSGYVHWIELYDSDNRKIDPSKESPKPYSPEKTCGRCHDYATISHGWHFNATDANASHGRPGQPWVWSDSRTGTHIPISYRDWEGTFSPEALGLSRWEVAEKLGGYMPGGGVGSKESFEADAVESEGDRSAVTGPLPVDCMICHRSQGSGYSPFVWTEQIEDQNFAYAPSAALGIATVSGNMTRLKADFDATAEGAEAKLPKIEYNASKFRNDGKVFFDLVRKPESNSCNYCHTNTSVDAVAGSRWLHDEDVHTRAGIQCADCHRNSLDHHTVRAFDGEVHPAGALAAEFSCRGCHLGDDGSPIKPVQGAALAGRLGAPNPAHRGLPPIHFEKMTCTSCHSGPLPSTAAGRENNSITHHLGHHVKRSGMESPGIVAGVQLPLKSWTAGNAEAAGDAEVEFKRESSAASMPFAPHRMMWPSYWGLLENEVVKPLAPEKAYELVRKPLKVRREFEEELSKVKLSLALRKELLGEDRYRVKEDERTEEEGAKIAAAENEELKSQVNERMSAALAAIEEEYPNATAVYISGGSGFVRDDDEGIKLVDSPAVASAAQPYAWPIAHNVRPARQSLGSTGCTECHSDTALYFHTEVQPVGVLPTQETVPIEAIAMYDIDVTKLTTWNQMFAGRSLFKIAGLIALGATCLIVLSAMAWSLGSGLRR